MIMRRRILVIALLGMVVVLPALTVAIAPRLAANPPWNVQSWFEQVYPTYTPMPSGRPEQNYIPTQASLEEALALLEKAISAMSEVKSYHFVLLNHEDLQGSEQFPHDREQLEKSLAVEGDVVPPMARLDGKPERLVIGTDRYDQRGTTDTYLQIPGTWETYVFNGGLNDPVRFLKYARRAECGGILGEEVVGGVDTVHVRFAVVRGDGSSPESYPGHSAAWDLWIIKDTYHVKQLQMLNIYDGVRALCKRGIYQPSDGYHTAGLLIFSDFNKPVEPPIVKPSPDKVVMPKPLPTRKPYVVPPTATPSAGPGTAPLSPTPVTAATPGPAPKSTMTEQEAKGLLERARNRMNAVKSYHFTMRGPAEGSQAGETIAEGDVQRPDKARFQVDGGTLLSTSEQPKDEIVQYEGDEYIKKGATDKYELMPFGAEGDLIYGVWGMMSPWTFDAASGFAEEVLFQGYEQIDGVETARILFTYDSSKLMARVAKGLDTPGPMTTGPTPLFAEAYIDPQSGNVLRFRFQVIGMMVGQGTPWAAVTLDYSRFDDPAIPPIERPSP